MNHSYDITTAPAIELGTNIFGKAKYTVRNSTHASKIVISKKDSDFLNYKVSVIYHGIKQNRSVWEIHINDQNIELTFNGTKKFNFKPINKNTIEIQEKGEADTEVIWIDISHPTYSTFTVCKHTQSPAISPNFLSLIEKAKKFEPDDGKTVKRIFFSQSVGVFIETMRKVFTDTYFSHDITREFSKLPILQVGKTPEGDDTFQTILPQDSTWRTFQITNTCKEPIHPGFTLLQVIQVEKAISKPEEDDLPLLQSPLSKEKLDLLILLAMRFIPESGTLASQIYYSEDSGVFILISKEGRKEIYYAKDAEENFTKCQSVKIICKRPRGGLLFKAILPSKNTEILFDACNESSNSKWARKLKIFELSQII